ncbi:MAG: thioredoxin domain-containing protein [Paracoccaceae bacterium]|nr:thioredoxin domain-containing protein [Paracoccaceae bacterium]
MSIVRSLKVILIVSLGLLPVIGFADDNDPEQYRDMIKGDINSDFTIVEYASFTCPHCATFHKEFFPYLEEKYINTGKAKFVYREVYFDAPGLWAGLLARCGSKEKYFGIVDLLYKKQHRWATGKSEKDILNELFAIGRQVGMKEGDINSCLQNKTKSLNLIDAYLTNSKEDKISSTPSLVVNGKLITYTGFDDLKIQLEEILK